MVFRHAFVGSRHINGRLFHTAIGLLCLFSGVVAASQPQPVKRPAPVNQPYEAASATRAIGLSSSYGKLPLAFEVNQGQTASEVKFLSHGTGYSLFLTGDEASYDSVMTGGQVVWDSVSNYLPTPLEVLRNPWIQWIVLMPRDIGGPEYDGIRAVAPTALRALGLDTGLTHLEWFRRPDGSVAVSEVAVRPPGGQITSMLCYAHDFDLYRAWGQLMVHGTFAPPPRNWSVGTVFIRGQGTGRVRAVHGLDELPPEVTSIVVESRLPEPGQQSSGGYEGDGYIIVRHPETAVVAGAVRRLVTGVRVELG